MSTDKHFQAITLNTDVLQGLIECQEACPISTNCRAYINAVAEGNYELGYQLAREPNPIVSVLAYVCSAQCEGACRRGAIDKPLAIRKLKRFLVDYAEEFSRPNLPPTRQAPTGKRVAIIGAGPAGLGAAHNLATWGHQVVVFDDLPVPGGTALSGIPPFRLPREIIERDVNTIRALGVQFRQNTRVGRDIAFAELERDFDAILIATGCQKPARLGVPGEEYRGVMHALEFLWLANLGKPAPVGRRVAVIGGGYTAMDASRTALRVPTYERGMERLTGETGAQSVQIVYRRTRAEQGVDEEELHEVEIERIHTEYLVSPVRVLSEDGQNVTGLELVRNRLGDPDRRGKRSPVPIPGSEFVVPVDTILYAIGQAPDLSLLGDSDLQLTERGNLSVNRETFQTSKPNVYAAGDFVTGPRTLVEALADGMRAAIHLDRYLQGQDQQFQVVEKISVTSTLGARWPREWNQDYDAMPRQHPPALPYAQRRNQFRIVEKVFPEDIAVAEAQRCLRCNYNIFIDGERCILCNDCVEICPYDCIHMVDLASIDNSQAAEGDIHEAQQWEEGAAMIMDEKRCIRCGLCIIACPVDAISMERFEMEAYTDDEKLLEQSHF